MGDEDLINAPCAAESSEGEHDLHLEYEHGSGWFMVCYDCPAWRPATDEELDYDED